MTISRHILAAWILSTVAACSDAKLQSAGQIVADFEAAEVVEESAAANAEPEKTADVEPEKEIVAAPEATLAPEPEKVIPPETAIDPGPAPAPTQAIAPISVGGAFLVCIQSTEVNCRLDSRIRRNIPVAASATLRFSYQGSPVGFSDASLPGWRWKLETPSLASGSIEVILKILNQDILEQELKAVVEASPLQIGDGNTLFQPGCTEEIGRQTQPAGAEFVKPFTVADQEVVTIDLIGICGVIRANDSFVQVLNERDEEILKTFLPITNVAIDRHFTLPRLPAGQYRLKMHAGDDIDIDDFYISNLSISISGP